MQKAVVDSGPQGTPPLFHAARASRSGASRRRRNCPQTRQFTFCVTSALKQDSAPTGAVTWQR